MNTTNVPPPVGPVQRKRSEKQRRLGPAPIASFEMSFDDSTNNEVRSKMDTGNVPENRLPDIRESETPITVKPSAVTNNNLNNMSTGPTNLGVHAPRIDISRASSSSQQEDSRESSPENVFEQVGTGTLQESTKAGLGFHEDGTMDLRSSTEELYFLEGDKEKAVESSDKFTQQVRRSPIMFKFDEHQTCLQQNQRKDSASSEVAALLCISGRTSRISSVGSQGSAVSRLSAMSGVSRSPSPHKMILETSFCGPKPLDNIVSGGLVSSSDPPTVEILEQVLLARKHDPTQAILAEGVKIDTSTPKKQKTTAKPVGNGNVTDRPVVNVEKLTKPIPSVASTRIAGKGGGVLKASSKPIVGKTTSGVEYIRIKLKPDHLYADKGLGENEKVLEDTADAVKKPASLSLGKDTPSKKAAPHFSQLVKSDDAITKHPEQVPPSPKTVRHIALRDSRSPSPATVAVSRKSSFCSLFKSKEVAASPESPIVINQRKKSGISLLSELTDSPKSRDRSRSKSRESDRDVSQNNTPSKQKSVLAIFKPKRSGSKSKSSSPIDPEAMATLDSADFKYIADPTPASTESRPRSRLRYYDSPLDGKTIHIPLHTPPDEKDNNICTVNVIKERRQQNEQNNAAKQPQQQPQLEEEAPPKELITKQKPKPPTEKVYRIENADGSIWIPLKSPTDDHSKTDEDSMWSVEANRNSSVGSEGTVVSSRAPSNASTEVTYSNQRKLSKTSLKDTETLPSNDGAPITPNTSIASISPPVPSSFVTPASVQTHTTTTAATTVPATSVATTTTTTAKEKRRILFCTKIGSGSQEQIFATQLSLSKTESLCSQLSEQASILESPVEAKEMTVVDEAVASPVTMRNKDSFDKSTMLNDAKVDSKEKFDKSNRHSKYIDNIDEIMAVQKQLEEERMESMRREMHRRSVEEKKVPSTTRKPDPVLQIPGPPQDSHSLSAEERCGSSESELDSELTAKHVCNAVGSIEEESARLVEQGSFDELPYVPTTLPEERPVGIAIVPVKERSLMDVKTCPVERPRSTTPLNPCHLEEYCGTLPPTEDPDGGIVRGEKLRISLPRKEAKEKATKSPRRISNTSGKSWFEFAEQGIGGTGSDRRNSNPDEDPPPLPPRKPQNVSQWINFENIPEKRKQPKRITTLPNKESSYDKNAPHQIQYNYVNPEECQCECHEIERDGGGKVEGNKKNEESENEDTLPLLEGEGSDGANRASASDGSLESPHEQQSEHVSRSRTRDMDDFHGESSSGHRRDYHSSADSASTSSKRTNFHKKH
ncbi:uncharacterized protein LOC119076012 isoform X1 [Bradysia coprophila]|uniref:uncharacterized protein LOC119076012 isoform X1 n=1 Tax=Bradysia coprophila TaxID=38358 RepID=UPI00187DADDA|nr:uncharacterized protein LOC119076012 isoform X1 [Bradysia coprophila]